MLFIIAGSAGAGKTTVIGKVIERLGAENINRFPTCTTRMPRPGEVNGRDYYFFSKDEFIEHIKSHDIVEAKKVYGNIYGTNLDAILNTLHTSKVAIKDFDVEGCANVKRRINQVLERKGMDPIPVVMVLIDAPDDVLVARMKQRNDNTNVLERERELIKERVIKRKTQYDYIITNDDLEKSVDTLCDIIKREYARKYNRPLLPVKTGIPAIKLSQQYL